jgi:methylglutaconyl-CoA hydratase
MAGLTINTTLEDGVFWISLNRPDVRNALDEALIEGLRQGVEKAAAEREALVVGLRGEGPAFCAGADVAWMREMGAAGEEENRRSAERLAQLFLALDRLEKPLVGRIHGAALGGGVGLAAVCDVAVASRTCRFALSEVRLGVIPAVIAPYLLRKMGPGRTRELILTGRRFSGEEAAAWGLVSQAADESLLDAAVEAVIRDLRSGGPQAQAQSKKLLRDLLSRPRSDQELAAWTAQLTAAARAGEEARSGLLAFLEKKPPPWAGTGSHREK